ncbi:MAG: TetR/AcrR family transcriptional regulator [Actinomycetota bacterium]|nr:TetR/AcrR family transcriptional regulator [Actinomycetota bacterium]
MGKQDYESPLRTAQAARTRRQIIDAARRAFVRDGYSGTSMTALAREAGVSRETIYKAFRTKPDLLKAVYDVAVVGDHEAVPVADRPEYTRMLDDPDPDAAARTFGMLSAELVERIGPVLRVLADAAHEPDLQDLLDATRAERLEGTRSMLVRLSGGSAGPALDRAVDVVWTLISPEVALLLTDQRGWTREQYGRWLGEAVAEQVRRLR